MLHSGCPPPPPQVCLVLCSCVVVLRWKDMLLAHSLLPQIEALDRGQELVASFVNPASK